MVLMEYSDCCSLLGSCSDQIQMKQSGRQKDRYFKGKKCSTTRIRICVVLKCSRE